jgi:hypothetical protein
MENKDKKEANWGDCIFYKTARAVTPDIARSRFLLKASKERAEYLETLEETDKGINFIFEGYYTSIIELIQSITTLEGYNILNHLCLGYYLRDILKKETLFRIFDSCRIKRNGLIYYGKMMEFEIAKQALEQAKILFNELNLIAKERHKIF